LFITQCLIESRTINLNKCKDKALSLRTGKAIQANSHYARFIRFFKMKEISQFILGIQYLLVNISKIDLTYIIVDRTNWKRGIKNINLLTIGGLSSGIFLPLCWTQLDKQGNSNFEDRKQLVERFVNLLKKKCGDISSMILLADREFIGAEWFKYLVELELHFVIRLKAKMYFDLQTYEGKKRTSLKYFNTYVERFGIYATPMELNGCSYSFVIIKNPKHNPKEPYIYFISDLKDAKAIANHYLKRWKIESAFKHLKTNGFNIENANLKDDLKIELLMAIVVFAYAVAVKEGILRMNTIKMKKYNNGKTYLSVSVFRTGYTILQTFCKTISQFVEFIESLILHGPFKLNECNACSGFV
jgi:Transposase DDE domain